MNKYGGNRVNLNTLPVGTSFYVYNDDWYGFITKRDGIKYIVIEGIREVALTGTDEEILDIKIIPSIFEVEYEQKSVIKGIVVATSLDEAVEKVNSGCTLTDPFVDVSDKIIININQIN